VFLSLLSRPLLASLIAICLPLGEGDEAGISFPPRRPGPPALSISPGAFLDSKTSV